MNKVCQCVQIFFTPEESYNMEQYSAMLPRLRQHASAVEALLVFISRLTTPLEASVGYFDYLQLTRQPNLSKSAIKFTLTCATYAASPDSLWSSCKASSLAAGYFTLLHHII